MNVVTGSGHVFTTVHVAAMLLPLGNLVLYLDRSNNLHRAPGLKANDPETKQVRRAMPIDISFERILSRLRILGVLECCALGSVLVGMEREWDITARTDQHHKITIHQKLLTMPWGS
jgi:hypothetical protein